MSDKNGKVIRLPIKPKGSNVAQGMFLDSSHSVALYSSSKLRVSVAIVSVVIAVTMMNKILLDRPMAVKGVQVAPVSRGIASIGSPINKSDKVYGWEGQIKDQLIREGSRGPASLGKRASIEDQLQFGLLEGKYAVNYRDGLLNEVRFVAQSDQPEYLVNRLDFIQQYRDLVAEDFEVVRLQDRSAVGRVTREVYSLLLGESQVAEISFQLDLHDRLLSLAVTRTAD